MKNIFKLFISTILALSFAYAQPISQSGNKNGYDVKLSSQKSLVVGQNTLFVELFKNNQQVTNAKVKIKFFMPKMPGMPYMEFKDKGVLENNKYKLQINFSMSGTWQYQLKFKTNDGKVHKLSGSVNL